MRIYLIATLAVTNEVLDVEYIFTYTIIKHKTVRVIDENW